MVFLLDFYGTRFLAGSDELLIERQRFGGHVSIQMLL